MSRPEPPFYVGSTRPGAVGWTRIGVTAAMGLVLAVLLLVAPTGIGVPLTLLMMAVFALIALWNWMRMWTRFIVDDKGVTVSWGGFVPRRPWDLYDFRTVQLRDIPGSTVGVTVGSLGWRTGRVLVGEPGQRRPVAGRKVHTPGGPQARYRLLVTRPGTMVEIIGRGEVNYLLSAQEPEATAAAIDQAIRARR